jgi:prepilin-type N-terminal cleavage/methylation domain-containing protein
MKRSAFTLIELLVSIALFGLITVFMFGAIDELRKQYTFFEEKEAILAKKNQIISLLRRDLTLAPSVSVTASSSRDFDTVTIIGSNQSLYETDRPYVVWLILKAGNTLIRLESLHPIILPIKPEMLYRIQSDRIENNCEQFRIYDSLRHRLIYLKFTDKSPLILEVMK